ncbi:MAG: (R)-phenoxypropionate/alpha-ketoglutarate-dioxygenase [Alphaproteobacteria bacterium MarineAlpha5_Bin12]|nr:MAG: (R)-phenoxypropionate/alpha-ketoglutarate-dioxygenase [Alphaproteobacteria bacterium MarineAlpha5_Bin12]|tara:strand:+ start:18683 stop:19525 length:843 start_codon:yes stop_codon:yes gene_type:complete
MAKECMEINLLSGALGAEIGGISLKDTSIENHKKINDLLLEHKVIFFRDQNISPEEQIKLASCFGPVEKHVYVKGRKEYPEIIRIIKEPDEKNQWGENWHSDVSYNPKPTKAVILKSIKIPPVGGDTVFSNMELAWETLDQDIKDKIKDKKAIHSSLGAAFFVNDYKAMEGNGNYDEYSNEHPIVRTHPETGKKILFVNWTYTKKIVGMEKNESDEILYKIFKHQERLDLTCRFRWTTNAVAIWDNRSVNHYAIADFFPGRGLGYERIMDRIAIEGDKPN